MELGILTGKYDLVLTDMGMRGMSGDELTAAIKELVPGQPVVLLTGFGKSTPETQGNRARPDVVVGKPISPAHLREALARAMVLRPA